MAHLRVLPAIPSATPSGTEKGARGLDALLDASKAVQRLPAQVRRRMLRRARALVANGVSEQTTAGKCR